MENKTSVNSSSIIDLKAELFRKQEEFKQQKLQNSQSGFAKAKPAEKKPTIWSKTNSGVLERAQKDLEAKVEEENVFENSKRSLEAKAKLYKQMTEGTDIPEEDGSQVYLVDFQKKVIDDIVEKREKKRQQEEEDLVKREEELLTNAVIPPPKSEGEEWVDYVDALGRSRRCMKKDLPYLKRQDERLGIKESKQDDRAQDLTPELLSNDMRREMLRQKWEEEEKAAMNQPIHYSNVQFDEIRTHGVGFYQFDKKESGRQEQMETLSNLRQKTKEERDRKERIKEKRKAILDARLAKVKQRKLKREGKETFGTDFHQEIDEEDDDNVIGPKIEEKVDDKEEEKKQTMEKQLLNRENQPKKIVPVREWDKGKEIYISETTKNTGLPFFFQQILRLSEMTSRKQVLSEEVLSNHIAKGYRSGITNEDRNKEYDGYAENFDESTVARKYVAPRLAAEKVAEYISPANRCSAVVLDIGAGTGLVGEQLQRLGFKTIDALEPSKGMIANAEKKNVYRNFICDSISEKPLEIPTGTYDVITVVGSHGPNHIPPLAFCEMIRLSKSGAIICVITRSNNFTSNDGYDDLLYPICEQLEEARKWKKREVYTFPNYLPGIEGIIIVYQVL